MKKEKKKTETNDLGDIKKLTIIVLVILVIFGLVYLLTLGANKLGLFEEHYKSPETTESVISYEKIPAGTILNRETGEYYVLISDFSQNKSVYLEGLYSTYNKKETKINIYIVDLSDELNKSIIGEKDNKDAKSIKELSIKNSTLLKIKNNKIVKYLIDIEDIENELK